MEPGLIEQQREAYEIEGDCAYRGIYNRYTKRVLGLMLAIAFVIVLLPFFVIVSILIVAETGFPVFYIAERGGYKGKTFNIFKFRSMVQNADKIGGGTTSLNDRRITKVGNFLRKTKLDEIAQLINIIKGEMSFIGPRPELLKYTNAYVGLEKCILQVRPGITDYSSIEFINLDEIVGGSNAEERYEKNVLKRKNLLRIKYATTVSFENDVKLFFTTIIHVIKKTFSFIFNENIKEK